MIMQMSPYMKELGDKIRLNTSETLQNS